MKVLMFGWEFAPIYSGGLGVACAGLTKGLVGKNVEVTFVIPKKKGDVETHVIPGEHMGILREPGARRISETINQYIRE